MPGLGAAGERMRKGEAMSIEDRLLRRANEMRAHRTAKLHREIAALHRLGMNQERIAVLMNCSQPNVSQVLSK